MNYRTDTLNSSLYTCVEIELRDLIALIEIYDQYESFKNDILTFLNNNPTSIYYSGITDYLEKYNTKDSLSRKISKKKRKAYEFYISHKDVIETIDNNTYFCDFINYGMIEYNGSLRKDLDYFYTYFKQNENELETIKRLLYKLKEYNATKIYFSPDYDFSKDEVGINYKALNSSYISLSYFDKYEVMPSYQSNALFYKGTKDTKLKINLSFDYHDNLPSKYLISVYLNSFIVDINTLISSLSRDEFEALVGDELKKIINDNQIVAKSVDLMLAADKFNNAFKETEDAILRASIAKNEDEIVTIVKEIKEKVDLLNEKINKRVEEEVSKSEILDYEKIEEEKKRIYSKYRMVYY